MKYESAQERYDKTERKRNKKDLQKARADHFDRCSFNWKMLALQPLPNSHTTPTHMCV
jgi:hypothetical protein